MVATTEGQGWGADDQVEDEEAQPCPWCGAEQMDWHTCQACLGSGEDDRGAECMGCVGTGGEWRCSACGRFLLEQDDNDSFLWHAQETCEHDWEVETCDRCGGYQGMGCNHCEAWHDGGDHMAAMPELWCCCRE